MKYHRIIIDHKPFYREYHSLSETYSLTMFTKEELAEKLMDAVVDDEIEFDECKLNEILSKMTNHQDKMYVINYIQYLERLD